MLPAAPLQGRDRVQRSRTTIKDLAHFYATHQTDNPETDRDRLGKLVKRAVERGPRRLLDVGCGRGTLLSMLRAAVPDAELYGVELNPRSAAEARAAGHRVEEASADSLPFDDDWFDLVIMGELIEHVLDPDACIEELRRVTSPGGRVIITTPNLACWANRLILLAGLQPLFSETSTRKKYGRGFAFLGDGRAQAEGHLRLFTLGALVAMLEDLGLRVVRREGALFPGFLGFPVAAQLERLFSRIPSLASSLIVVADKPDK